MTTFYRSPKFSLAILALATLQAGCSSGSGGGSTTATPTSQQVGVSAVTSFSPSLDSVAPLATSSSNLNMQNISDALANGGNISTTAILFKATRKTLLDNQRHTTGFYETENSLTSNTELEIQFSDEESAPFFASFVSDGVTQQVSVDDFRLYGTYGTLVVGGPVDDVIEGNVITSKYSNAIIGIKTDSNNMPTEGTATYVAKESLGQLSTAYYSGLDSSNSDFSYASEYYDDSSNPIIDHSNPIDDNGDFITTLNANFASATINGSAEGTLSSRNRVSGEAPEQLDLPATVQFNETSITNSDFFGNGTATIDNKTIAVNYGGSLFGPNAEETSVIFAGTHSDGTILNGAAYLLQQ